MTPKQNILDYRAEKYGIDELTGESALVSWTKTSLHSMVDILSKQLYSKDVHFIFELIQNAEDNHYSDGVPPKLHFELLDEDPTNTEGAEGCLVIFNNELGFQFKNVDAISSVGESTKKSSKDAGYIGEKGIGFKSVFSVTSAPHIFSNGYQFSFKEKDPITELGYIIPYWIDDVPPIVQDRLHSFTTCILLPLKGGASTRKKIEEELSNLDSTLLLFLNKVTEITVSVDEQVRRYAKEVNDEGVTLLTNEFDGVRTEEQYLVKKKAIAVPEGLNEEKRDSVFKRELCLAFPISDTSKPHKVYSYLPTEIMSGLPFLVNADFLLPASRESILIDREWNLWMQNEVAEFASEEISLLVNDYPYKHSFFWIPEQDECASSFFEPVFNRVIEMLKELEFIPSACGDKKIAPQQAIFPPLVLAQIIEKLRAVDTPYQFASKEVLNFAAQLKPLVAYEDISEAQLSEFFIHAEAPLQEQPASWFVELYSWLQKRADDWWDWRDYLESAPLFPCNNGELLTGKDQIFRNSNIRIHYPELKAGESSADVALLNKELQSELKDQSVVKAFLKDRFGIESLTQNEYLFRVALPFCEDNLDQMNSDSLWELNKFTIQNWDALRKEDLEDLSTQLPLKLNSGEFVINEKNQQVVTPRMYTEGSSWQVLYSPKEQEDFLVLSDEYLELLSDYEKRSPQEIFDCLQASSNPALFYEMSVFGGHSIPKGIFSDEYKDYLSEHVDSMPYGTSDARKRGKLIRIPKKMRNPDSFNHREFRQAFYTWLTSIISADQSRVLTYKKPQWKFQKIRSFYYSTQYKTVVSELWFALEKTPCILTNNGLKSIGEVFAGSPDEKSLYGNLLNFVSNEVPLALIEGLDIPHHVNPDSIVNVLRHWSKENKELASSEVIKIYSQLQRQLYDLEELFCEEPLIYCPSREKNWCSSQNAVWGSQKDVLGDSFHWLSDTYRSFHKTFWLSVGVADEPSAELFANAWIELQSGNDEDPRGALEVILDSLVLELRKYKEGELPEWFGEFEQYAHCFSYKNKVDDSDWHDPSEIYAADIPRPLRTLLEGDGARFIWIPDGKQHSRYDRIYSELEVKYASEAIEKSAVIDEERCFEPEDRLLTPYSKVLLACLVKNSSEKDLFESEGLIEIIQAEECTVEDSLEVTYELGLSKVTKASTSYFDGHTFYCLEQEDRDNLKEELAAEISQRLFKRDYRRHEDTIIRILGVGEKRAQKLMDSKGWKLTKKEREEFYGLVEQERLAAVEDTEEERVTSLESDDREVENLGSQFESYSTGTDAEESELDSFDDKADDISQVKVTRERKTPNSFRERTNNPQSRATRTTPKDSSSSSSGSGSRMLSYVKPKESTEGSSSKGSNEKIMEYANRAEEIVTKLLEGSGYTVTLLGGTNPGFDIKVKSGDEDIFVEVKSTQGAWNNTGVGLSSRQFELSQKEKSNYWLYIVEYADTEEPKVYKLVNPSEKIDAFYFDQNWKELAVQEEQERIAQAGDLGIYELFEGDVDKLYEDL